MSTQQVDHILIAGGEDRDVMRILDASPGLNEDRVHRVASSREAVDRLSDPCHPFSLALVDRRLEPETAFSLIQFVRRDAGSPYPGLALGFIGDGITQSELRLAMRAGCPIALSRPFNRQVLASAIKGLPIDRSDFIITGAYVGPERRRPGDTPAASNRRSSTLAEQSIASTADRYDIAPETIGFRFKRLPVRGGPCGLALRNGLSRRTVVPAFEHIGEKKREGVTLIGRQAQSMGQTWNDLQTTMAPAALDRLNSQASASARLSVQRGLTLLGAITGSLSRYSSGEHGLGPRLVAFLRAHLDGVGAALRHRIDDDGGPVGRQIMATLKEAERAFAIDQDKPRKAG